MSACKPTVRMLAIALAEASYHGDKAAWLAADEVRGRLRAFGWDVSGQWVAEALARAAREDAPIAEREYQSWGCWAYRLTIYGANEIQNNTGLHLTFTTRLPALPREDGTT